ncbi:MAG TPA: hypothetical protein VGD45_14650 [Steroidobacter sp.]|uniref:hypothetical protein n=1 Tax=Steroidobacter sp. TaxID=1978227 RepID=UPI002ED803BC
MKQFVIIFRQAPREFTEADLKQRSEQTRIWAAPLNTAGHKLDPRILEPASQWSGADAPVTALLFLEARDFEQATQIARSHPAIRYDASVEVRAWAGVKP